MRSNFKANFHWKLLVITYTGNESSIKLAHKQACVWAVLFRTLIYGSTVIWTNHLFGKDSVIEISELHSKNGDFTMRFDVMVCSAITNNVGYNALRTSRIHDCIRCSNGCFRWSNSIAHAFWNGIIGFLPHGENPQIEPAEACTDHAQSSSDPAKKKRRWESARIILFLIGISWALDKRNGPFPPF